MVEVVVDGQEVKYSGGNGSGIVVIRYKIDDKEFYENKKLTI